VESVEPESEDEDEDEAEELDELDDESEDEVVGLLLGAWRVSSEDDESLLLSVALGEAVDDEEVDEVESVEVEPVVEPVVELDAVVVCAADSIDPMSPKTPATPASVTAIATPAVRRAPERTALIPRCMPAMPGPSCVCGDPIDRPAMRIRDAAERSL
jgi:hypothetical protein